MWAGRKQRRPFTHAGQSPEKVSTSWLSAGPRTKTSSRHSFLFSASGSDKPLLLSKAPKQISGSLEQQASETPNTSRGLKMLSLDGVLPPRPLKLPGRSAPPLSVEGSAPSPLLRCGETEAGDTNTSDAQEMVSVRMLVPQPGKGGLTQTLALPPVSRTTPNSVPSSPSAPEPLPRVQGAPYPR